MHSTNTQHCLDAMAIIIRASIHIVLFTMCVPGFHLIFNIDIVVISMLQMRKLKDMLRNLTKVTHLVPCGARSQTQIKYPRVIQPPLQCHLICFDHASELKTQICNNLVFIWMAQRNLKLIVLKTKLIFLSTNVLPPSKTQTPVLLSIQLSKL